jgi:hypothetical protein
MDGVYFIRIPSSNIVVYGTRTTSNAKENEQADEPINSQCGKHIATADDACWLVQTSFFL